MAYRRPGAALLTTFPRLNGLGYPTTFSIVGAIVNAHCEASWYRVKLPMRPNGVVGYVRPANVRRREGDHAHLGRPVAARARPVPRRQARPEDAGRGRLAGDADADRTLLREPADHGRRTRTDRSDRPSSASRPSRTFSPTGRREARSPSTGRTSPGRSDAPSRTAASASRTPRSSGCSHSPRRGRRSSSIPDAILRRWPSRRNNSRRTSSSDWRTAARKRSRSSSASFPAGTRWSGRRTRCFARVDELTKRMRSLDPLERRVVRARAAPGRARQDQAGDEADDDGGQAEAQAPGIRRPQDRFLASPARAGAAPAARPRSGPASFPAARRRAGSAAARPTSTDTVAPRRSSAFGWGRCVPR